MSNADKTVELAEELAQVALQRGTEAGLQAHEILQVVGATLVSLTASIAKPGYLTHSLLTMLAAVAMDARTVMITAEREAAAQDAEE